MIHGTLISAHEGRRCSGEGGATVAVGSFLPSFPAAGHLDYYGTRVRLQPRGYFFTSRLCGWHEKMSVPGGTWWYPSGTWGRHTG